MTCRYRFILMGASTRRETSMASLMEFNDSIWVLSPLLFVIKAEAASQSLLLREAFTLDLNSIRYLLVRVLIN